MSAIVLIHGAGLDSYIWEPFLHHLKQPVLCIEFPHRQQQNGSTKKLGFETYLNGAIEQIMIPNPGKSFAQCFPKPVSFMLPLLLRVFGTKPPDKTIEKELCNDLNSEQKQKIITRFTPESIKLYTTKIQYSEIPSNSLYVKTIEDQALNIQLQDKMVKNLHCKKVVELSSGHLPMLSQPIALARIVNEFINNSG